MGDAKAVLFVDDEQTEVAKDDLLLEKPVGADDDVDFACGEPLHDRTGLLCRREPGKGFDPHGIALEALAKGRRMLLAQNRGGDEHGDLFAIEGSPETSADRDFGLSVADIAADQPVHGSRMLHARQHVLDGGALVRRFFEGKGGLEFLEVGVSGRKRKTGGDFARSVHGQKFRGHVAERFLDLVASLLPGLSTETVNARLHAVGASVTLDEVEPIHRQEESVATEVLHAQEFADDAARLQFHEAAVGANPVFGVNEIVPRRQLGDAVDGGARVPLGASASPFTRPEDFLLGDDSETFGRQHEPFGEARHPNLEPPWRRPFPDRAGMRGKARFEVVTREKRAKALGAGQGRARQDDAPAVGLPADELIDEGFEGAFMGARSRQLAPERLVTGAPHLEGLAGASALGNCQSFQDHRVSLEEGLHKCLRRQHQFFGRCRWATALASSGEIVFRVGEPFLEVLAPAVGLIDDDQRVLGEEVEHGLLLRGKPGGDGFDARRCVAPYQRVDPGTHFFLATRDVARAREQVLARRHGGSAIKKHLARGRKGDPGEREL